MSTPHEPPPNVKINRWYSMVTVFRAWLRLPNGEKAIDDALREAKRKESARVSEIGDDE